MIDDDGAFGDGFQLTPLTWGQAAEIVVAIIFVILLAAVFLTCAIVQFIWNAQRELAKMDESEVPVNEDLALDLLVYGSCYWKYVDGRKVRIHPQDVRIIKGEPRDSSNTVCTSEKTKGE